MVLCCPKGAGPGIRAVYERGGGVFGLFAVHQDATGRARTPCSPTPRRSAAAARAS